MITRRGFLRGLSVAVAAPAIVRAASLMPVSTLPDGVYEFSWYEPVYNGALTPPLYARDLMAVMRRAFIPKVRDQLFMPSPAMLRLLDETRT